MASLLSTALARADSASPLPAVDLLQQQGLRLSPPPTADLLRHQLLIVEPNKAYQQPQSSIDLFEANQSLTPADFFWTYRWPAHKMHGCLNGLGCGDFNVAELKKTYHGNMKDPAFAGESIRTNVPSGATFEFHHPAVLISGSLTVPACKFDFLTNPTCYPTVKINNESTSQAIVFSIAQAGLSPPPQVKPGEVAAFDRSNGDLKLTLDEVSDASQASGSISDVKVTVLLGLGPPVDLSDDISEKARMETYSRIGHLRSILDYVLNSPDAAGQALEAKTLYTAIHILSAKAIRAKYPDVVLERLRNRAIDIAGIHEETIALRNAAIAANGETADQVDVIIARMDELLADKDLPQSQKDILLPMRQELVDARDNAKATSSTVQIFRDKFNSEIDRITADYQMLILEYAQYIPFDKLKGVLDDNSVEQIHERVAPSDVFIKDGDLSGHGAAIREAFGLPSP
jgi:hypothetical protein